MNTDTEIRILHKRYVDHIQQADKQIHSLECSERAHNRRIRALEVNQHRLILLVALQASCTAGIVCMALSGVI